MIVFNERMLPEVMDVFWGALARGGDGHRCR